MEVDFKYVIARHQHFEYEIAKIKKGIESWPQTKIFKSLNLCNPMYIKILHPSYKVKS